MDQTPEQLDKNNRNFGKAIGIYVPDIFAHLKSREVII
jgi:hypothetical protein